jgi:hypothetical protein
MLPEEYAFDRWRWGHVARFILLRAMIVTLCARAQKAQKSAYRLQRAARQVPCRAALTFVFDAADGMRRRRRQRDDAAEKKRRPHHTLYRYYAER